MWSAIVLALELGASGRSLCQTANKALGERVHRPAFFLNALSPPHPRLDHNVVTRSYRQLLRSQTYSRKQACEGRLLLI